MTDSSHGTAKHYALFVRSFEGSGGAERVLLNLGRGLVARGHRVDLVMARRAGHFLDQVPAQIRVVDLKVHSASASLRVLHRLGRDAWFWARMVLAKNPHYVLGALPKLAAYLREARPDALISSMDYPNVVAVAARDLARVESLVIATVHNTLSEEIARSKKRRVRAQAAVDRRFYPRADAVVAVSQGVADDLARTLGIPLPGLTTIFNPIVVEDLVKQAAEPLAHPWFADKGPPVLLAVGGMKPAKDHATLLRAFAMIRMERPVRLVLLGEGKLRDRLRRLAEELGVAADLDMPGFVENPYHYMARASVFVHSSLFEGFGLVLAEALVCGCPVVSTDCPSGPAEILDHGRFGRLVPMADAKALATAIKEALDTPHDKAQLFARGTDFSLEKATAKYLELIESVMRQP